MKDAGCVTGSRSDSQTWRAAGQVWLQLYSWMDWGLTHYLGVLGGWGKAEAACNDQCSDVRAPQLSSCRGRKAERSGVGDTLGGTGRRAVYPILSMGRKLGHGSLGTYFGWVVSLCLQAVSVALISPSTSSFCSGLGELGVTTGLRIMSQGVGWSDSTVYALHIAPRVQPPAPHKVTQSLPGAIPECTVTPEHCQAWPQVSHSTPNKKPR